MGRRGGLASLAQTEHHLLRSCPYICHEYSINLARRMDGMKLLEWIGRVAFVCIAWLALPIQSAVQAADFLDPEDAFRFSATVAEEGRSVAARFSIAEGYSLYHERFAFVASDGVRLGAPQYPPGKIKFDETFNKEVLTYRGDVVVRLPVEVGSGAFTLTASLQGCADQGICYPPEQRTAQLLLTAASNAAAPPGAGTASAGSEFVTATEQGRIDSALKSGSLLAVLPIFFVLGLLLSLTPCVLPMLPILSSIIVGKGALDREASGRGLTRTRGFVLALAYALGMAIVYTAFGIAAGLAGEGLPASLQHPWVLPLFAPLLFALALPLFVFYHF